MTTGRSHWISGRWGRMVGLRGMEIYDVALLDAVASGRIRAAIDVFPEEPIPPDERARHIPTTW